MIPNIDQCKKLWDKYDLPENKIRHCELVAKVARLLSEQYSINNWQLTINTKVLYAAALLHDIDKNIPKLSGEKHPDAAVRVLKDERMGEVAALVKSHPLHAILDPATAPKTIEEKILYLADKMVKYEIIGVDERFRLWNEEQMPAAARQILEGCYPRVKKLEKEIFDLCRISDFSDLMRRIAK